MADAQWDIELLNVTKQFGEQKAVDDLTLRVERGKFYSFLGPSGCGKTTTLRMIAGFEDPTRGEIRIAGSNVDGLPPYKRNVNTVFQHYALFPHMTVYDNVAYGLVQSKTPPEEIKRRVGEALSMVRLTGREKSFPKQLSGGQQQRVALARAFAPDPAILVADEPTGNLDEATGQQIVDLLFAKHAERGMTLVLVTHDTALAQRCDRVVRLRSGRIDRAAQ